MYKLLPILLFAFLIAEDKSAPPIIRLNSLYEEVMNNGFPSDSLEIVFVKKYLADDANIEMYRLMKRVSKIIDEEKINITIDNKNIELINDPIFYDSTELVPLTSLGNVTDMMEYIYYKSYIHGKRWRESVYIQFFIYKTPNISRVGNQEGWGFMAQFERVINIDIDKSILLTASKKQAIRRIIDDETNHGLYYDDIKFNSIDINNYNNKQVSLNRNDIYEDSWAVIIGIDKYKYSDQLNYAVKDAKAVKNMLINKFDYNEENIRYLTDEEATLSNIKLNLGEVATSAGENDRILVFYSGHGETLSGKDGTETGYIIPYEGKQNNPYATGLVMDEILRTCQMSDAKHMLFLMDACYSGLMTENVKGLSKPQEQGYLSKVANEKARQIITAGDSDEQVIERGEWQHSAFTKNLIEGLDTWEADYNNDGCITADELSTYLREHVTEDSDFQQTPQDGRFRNSGGGEFVFFGSGNDTSPTENNDIYERFYNSYPFGFDFGFNIKRINKSKYFSSNLIGTYENIFTGIDILLGYEKSNSIEKDLELNSNAIFIKLKNNEMFYSDEPLWDDGKMYPSFREMFGMFYFLLGLTIEDVKYNYSNELITDNIGFIPEIGAGFDFQAGQWEIGIGYAINDIKNVDNEKFYNGLVLRSGFKFNLIGWLDRRRSYKP